MLINWKVFLAPKAKKQYWRVPETVRTALDTLVGEIEVYGPIRGNRKNYGKLGDDKHHCHLRSGRPTYVACWEMVNKSQRIVEVYYVGTHEKAPY